MTVARWPTGVDNALEVCGTLVKQQDHELTVTLPEEPMYVDADKTRLAQVLCNLLSNAVKYSDRGSPVGLTVWREGNEAVVRVKDAGIGIQPQMLPSVFDLFTQLEGSLEKSEGGLGVGLAIVKRLIEMHGGSVEARSDGLGRGSEFMIRLPLVLAVTQVEQDDRDDPKTLQMTERRILIVDDNCENANAFVRATKV